MTKAAELKAKADAAWEALPRDPSWLQLSAARKATDDYHVARREEEAAQPDPPPIDTRPADPPPPMDYDLWRDQKRLDAEHAEEQAWWQDERNRLG